MKNGHYILLSDHFRFGVKNTPYYERNKNMACSYKKRALYSFEEMLRI